MIPTTVCFLSDEGDATGIDLDLLDRHRERIRRVLLNRGDSDSSTLGSAYMDLIELSNGDYLNVGWYARTDEEALVFSLRSGEVEEPPGS